MKRFFLRISFDGTDFSGWQIQENSNSIQQTLNEALSVLCGENIQSTGCGRTDAGVHSNKFYVHFDTSKESPVNEDFTYRINSILPESIVVHEVIPVNAEDHARFSAISRTYDYYLHHAKNPFVGRYSLFHPTVPDHTIMNEASAFLIGQKSFKAFSKGHSQVSNHICEITRAEWKYILPENRSVFTISSNRFLRGMVRAIVGTLLKVGTGKLTTEEFQNIISSDNRDNAGPSIAAYGLFLSDVQYPFIPSPDTEDKKASFLKK